MIKFDLITMSWLIYLLRMLRVQIY